jgi:WD40 repeat protein
VKKLIGYLISAIFTILIGVMFGQAGDMSALAVNGDAEQSLQESAEKLSIPLLNINPAAFSPDGNTLASIDESGTITLQDVATGQMLWTHFDTLNDVITGLSFSPNGKTLVSVGSNAVSLWHVDTGQESTSFPFTNMGAKSVQVEFSPDGKRLACTGLNEGILLWDMKAGTSKRLQANQDTTFEKLAFSHDGDILAGLAKGKQPKIMLWDTVTGRLHAALVSNSDVIGFAFSPNNEILAGIDKNGSVRLWDLHSGAVKRVLRTNEEITAIVFSPDSKVLAIGSGGTDSKIQLWNPVTGRLIFTKPSDAGQAVTSLFYSPDGALLASIGKDFRISLWNVHEARLQQLLLGQADEITKAAFNAKQPTLAAVGKDGRLIVWDLVTGMEQQSFQASSLLNATLVSPQIPLSTSVGSNASTTKTTQSFVSNASSLSPAAIPLVASQANPAKIKKRNAHKWKGVKALAISQDGTEMGAAGEDGIIRVFKKNGAQRWKMSGHHGSTIAGIAFRGKVKEWVSAGRDTEIKTWDDLTGNNLHTFYGPEHPLRAVAVSPDGRYIATAGEETRVFLFDAIAGKLSKILSGHVDFVNALAFSPDGHYLASAGAEGRTFLWDVNTGKSLRTLLGHSDEVNAVAFSPDGMLLATASEDSTVILWGLTSGQPSKILSGHQGGVRSVAFNPNGKKLVSAGIDSRMLVWNPATAQLVKQVTGSSAAINVLAFDPTGNLHVASENSEVSEFNTDTGIKVGTIVMPTPLTVTPQASRSNSVSIAIAPKLDKTVSTRFVNGNINTTKSHTTILSALINHVLNWIIPVANAAIPAPPGGSILIVTNGTPSFGDYYAEILRSEGLNEFVVADISTITSTPATLAAYDVVILAEMPLDAVTQVSIFSSWVNGGGNLIAMRPDKDLASLLGLTDENTTLDNAYLQVNTSVAPGSGIAGETMQYHGTADRYTLSGATSIATLYSNAVTITANPAVTLKSVGNGKAAAFTYDLAKSVVYTHQGNPGWATQERDGFAPKRSDDKFFGDAAGDSQLDWIDLTKVIIPQADEQQRLFVNLILEMNRNKKPLPRFWYFPSGLKAVVIMTGDDHSNGGTAGRFDQFIASSTPGCLWKNWECVRGTSYIYPNTPLTNAQAANYNAQGFEVGLHINTNCADFTPAELEAFYTDQIDTWTAKYNSIPAPITQRHHCIAWSDWVSAAKTELAHGIRLDTSYYFWPPSWVLNRPGFFSGSGMPMRFADINGSLIDVYQATSQMTDESGQSYPFTINSLLDKAVGEEAYYGAFTINAHTDVATTLESQSAVASAQAHGVPIITSRQMMDWLDFRNSSSFSNVAWSGNTLSFMVASGTGSENVPANGLQVLLPIQTSVGILTGLTVGGVNTAFTYTTIKGVDYAAFSGVSGSYVATYTVDTTSPTVTSKSPLAGSTGINQGVVVTTTFNEAINPATINSSTLELRDSSGNSVVASIGYNTNTHTAVLTPALPLAGSKLYTATIKGGTSDPRIKDLSGNALVANISWSFTTQAQPCSISSCSVWSNTTTPSNPQENDPNSVELGVKFRSDLNGVITGIRFYQANSGAGAGRTFQATLWDLVTQTPLATGTVTSTTSGWQQVSFSTPFTINANKVYVASYHAPNGNYAGDNGFFAASGVDNSPIHLLRDGENGSNGVYVYGVSRAYPTNTWQSSNYWVDVVFSTNIPADTTPPSVISTAPTANATGVNPASSVTVIFSEAMSASTINNTTIELRNSTGALVPAAISYNSGTNIAALTPTCSMPPCSLLASTVYTAKVIGGINGVKDLAGNALAVDKAWTFTTGIDPCSLLGGNPIVCENSRVGNTPAEWDISGAGDLSIQGFTTDISVNRGETVRFKIDTPSTNYRLDIYRMGYYAGNGARKIATVQPTAFPSQPTCLTNSTGLFDCGNWIESASWAVPTGAVSGIYFAKVVREDGTNTGASHIVFIVRDDASTSDILFQTADTTWQAYNNYGGNSLYGGSGPGTGLSAVGRAYKVSYNRPFNTRNVDGGQDWVFNAEYPMVRWLEANGYNVSYFTGIDSDRRGNLIRNHKMFMSNGHDEYWSGQQRANVEAARDAATNPVNLAFFSGNEVFWKTRWENSIDPSTTAYRTMVCYKETHEGVKIDPTSNVWTGTWRDPRFSLPLGSADGGRPENALMGTIFMVNDGATTSIKVPEADGKMRFWRSTSIASLASGASATLPLGTLGYEWDVDMDNGFRPAGLVRLSTSIVNNAPILTDNGSTFGSGVANHALTLYKASSGARVFGAGTIQWAWGLDGNHDRTVTSTNAAMQQATVNLFADMGVQPGTLQAGLTVAALSTDASPPVSTIVFPVTGAAITPSSVVTITGTATDAGGQVGGVEVSVDGGLTWHPANGRSNWSYVWAAPSVAGSVSIKSRAVDDSLNLQTTPTVITVNISTGSGATPPTAIADTFLFRTSLLRSINYAGALGQGVLANDIDSTSLPLTAQAVNNLPTGVTLASNGVVSVNRTTNTSFNYRANNGSLMSLPITGTSVTLRLDGAPTTVAESCAYNRAGSGSITLGSACAMTGTRVFAMNLIANDTDPNITNNLPTDGVGDAVTGAIVTATGTGVAVSANAVCGQAAIVKVASRATITNNCNGTVTVTVASAAPASPISLTYRALDDLGAQSATRNDVVTVN